MAPNVNDSRKILLGSGGHVPANRRAALIEEIRALFGPDVKKFLFIPYALLTHDRSVEEFQELNFNAGYEVDSIHKHEDDPKGAVQAAEAIYVDGGNCWRLLSELYKRDIVSAIHDKVLAGTPYVGLSAGAEIAAPTMRTTNDMPIVSPPSMDSLNIVSCQMNSHYYDMDISDVYRGETRERRIQEYHEEHNLPVLGLREGCILRVLGGSVTIRGTAGAKLFCKDKPPHDLLPDDNLDAIHSV